MLYGWWSILSDTDVVVCVVVVRVYQTQGVTWFFTHVSVTARLRVDHHPKISSQEQLCGQKLTTDEGLEDD